MGQKALNIRDFPEELKLELKIVALKKRTTLRNLIIDVLTAYVEKERGYDGGDRTTENKRQRPALVGVHQPSRQTKIR